MYDDLDDTGKLYWYIIVIIAVVILTIKIISLIKRPSK